MKTMIIILLVVCVAFIPTFADAAGRKILPTDQDMVLGNGNPINKMGVLLVNTTDNIAINWKQGNLTNSSQYFKICVGTFGDIALNWSNNLNEYYIGASPDSANCPSNMYNYYTKLVGPLSSPASFWVVPSSSGLMRIFIESNSNLTLNITLVPGNYFLDRDATLQNISRLQDHVNALQSNMSNTQISIYYLTQKIDALNTTLNVMNGTQSQMLDNISRLWINLDKLQVSLDDLADMVNGLNTSLNFTGNITRIEHDLTLLNADLASLQDQIELLSKDKEKIKEVQDQLNDTIVNLTAINSTVSVIKSTMPKAYNDTALKGRVAQLEYENNKLSDDLKSMNKKQEQASVQRGNDFKLVVLAMIIGIVGIMFGVFALVFAPLSRMPKGLDTEDLNIAKPPSDEYDELEPSPRHNPKAKAKKKKEEDLDDVMSKLKE